ncbi:MAG: FtsX-like permease family protein [Roseivirga sp.]|nr:FtsX-like permease family protein [Roseivirga sp.]
MVKNNIILAFRQLKRNRVFSFVNVLGLSLSMVACLLIFKYISFEKSYDNYHSDVDNIYRIYRHSERAQYGDDDVVPIFPAIGPLTKTDIPEFVQTSRFIGSEKMFQSFALSYFPKEGAAKTFNITKGYFADHDAINILGFDWTDESMQPSLDNPNEVVISRSTANKFFGNEPAVGKVLRFKNRGVNMKVTGVFEDLPENTHFKFELLCSFQSLPAEWKLDEDFGWGNFYTYARISDGADLATVEYKLNELLKDRETWYAEEQIVFKLQPIKDIHLKSDKVFELEANGNERTVFFMTIIGFFIMLIAWVNYINLSTSKLIDRAKEVGVRKVLGSYRSQLMNQFITESVVMNFLSIVLSLTVLQVTISFFESLLGIPIAFFTKEALPVTIQFVGLFTLGALLFGFYPALLFSKQKVTSVLKGRSRSSKSGLLLRRVLTVFQFAIALVLIIGTFTVYSQLQFMQNQSLGMTIDQTLIVRKPFTESASRASSEAAFVNGARQLSGVQAVSATSEIPGYEITRMRWIALGPNQGDQALYAKDIAIDEYFTDLYDIDVIHGRSFAPEFEDATGVVLNLSAARDLLGAEADLADWVNKTIYYETAPFTLIGIIDDISQQSLKNSAEAHIYTKRNRVKFYSVKVNTADINKTISELETVFGGSFASSHFDYFFLDEYFDRQYRSDRMFGQIFTFFSVLAIMITVLGLFGLSIYNIGQRAKEVSIRRVLGASFNSISLLLTKDYFLLIFIAAVVAVPLGYLMIEQWLANFANHLEIGLMLFVLPIVLVLVLTLLTVGYQVIKAAVANPAETLRWE